MKTVVSLWVLLAMLPIFNYSIVARPGGIPLPELPPEQKLAAQLKQMLTDAKTGFTLDRQWIGADGGRRSVHQVFQRKETEISVQIIRFQTEEATVEGLTAMLNGRSDGDPVKALDGLGEQAYASYSWIKFVKGSTLVSVQVNWRPPLVSHQSQAGQSQTEMKSNDPAEQAEPIHVIDGFDWVGKKLPLKATPPLARLCAEFLWGRL